MKRLLPPLFALAAVAGCASPSDGPAPGASANAATDERRQCFRTQQVAGFNAIDERTVNVRVGARDIYRLELLGPCNDIDWALRIGIEARGTSLICSGQDATIIAPTSLGPRRCAVRAIRKLTPEEASRPAPRP